MEWLEVPFGPLFPGLPGGLGLVLTLDGDTVVRADVRGGSLYRNLSASWPGPTETLADRLGRLDPLASTAYRILAWRALEQVSGSEPDEREMRRRIAALERERAASHLTWLGRFGFLLGDRWLAHEPSACARAIRSADHARAAGDVRDRIATLLGRVRRTPLVRQRLQGVGRIEPESAQNLRGPVARACGRTDDTRQDDPSYKAVGFAPVVEEGCDACARLSVRLAEIEQSLELIRATGVDVPSPVNVHLIGGVAVGHELADGLLGIASLDLSPWELDG
jgi:NADH-quinone oxidoreductase subunit D